MTSTLPPAPPPSALSPPPGPSSSSFDPAPQTVLPGDDLTGVIIKSPPPAGTSADPRKKKRSKKGPTDGGDEGRNDDTWPPPKIGSGLLCTYDKQGDESSIRVMAIVAGRLIYRSSSRTWYVASNPRRYHLTQSPMASASLAKSTRGLTANVGVGDRVIGVVEGKASADYYRVNIFGSHSALLHVLSFEGATKRNRPQLDSGALLYCRITKGFGGGRCDPEVSCKVGTSGNDTGKTTYNEGADEDGGASSKDWMTNEGTYGALSGGTSFRVSLGLARELLLPNNACLSALDKSGIPFEIAVGVNGMVWINSSEPEITITILNAIKNSEVMNDEQIRGVVKKMVRNCKKELQDDD